MYSGPSDPGDYQFKEQITAKQCSCFCFCFLLAWAIKRLNAKKKKVFASDIAMSGFLSIIFALKLPVVELRNSTMPKQGFSMKHLIYSPQPQMFLFIY